MPAQALDALQQLIDDQPRFGALDEHAQSNLYDPPQHMRDLVSQYQGGRTKAPRPILSFGPGARQSWKHLGTKDVSWNLTPQAAAS